MSTVAANPETLSIEQRTDRLNRTVQQYVAWGWRIQSQGPTQAQMVKGHRTNHILHLILTIITLGIWAIVWIGMVAFGGEKYKLISVDEYGNISA